MFFGSGSSRDDGDGDGCGGCGCGVGGGGGRLVKSEAQSCSALAFIDPGPGLFLRLAPTPDFPPKGSFRNRGVSRRQPFSVGVACED